MSKTMQSWTISRAKARDGNGWHIQARTTDQISSFAAVIHDGAHLMSSVTADGNAKVFSLVQSEPHITFNVVGAIRFTGDWKGML